MQRLTVLVLVLWMAVTVFSAAAAEGAAPTREDVWADMLAGQRSLAVSTAFDEDGRLWRVRSDGGHVVVDHSEDLGASFSPAVRVNPEPEVIGTEGDNRPKIAIADGGAIYVSYTRLLDRPFSGDIRFSRSLDGGQTFSKPLTVNDNRDIISHRFDSLIVGAGGEVYVAWIDRRDEVAARERGETYPGAAVYYAISKDRGESFAPNVKLADNSCECCRIALAFGHDGVPRAFWRHVFDGSERDHALMSLDARKPPRRITQDRWRIEACPHHGPALAIDADGIHHFAWFTNGTEAQGLFYARSTDGGESVSSPMALGDVDARPSHPAVITRSDEVFLAWREFDGETSAVRVKHSTDRGQSWAAPVTVARASDASDHPQLIADGDGGQVYLSWNALAEGFRLIPLEFEP